MEKYQDHSNLSILTAYPLTAEHNYLGNISKSYLKWPALKYLPAHQSAMVKAKSQSG